ncbi:hypothetical protein I317_07630 [Kwoniella heveanensis CBS 569]|nr:hypothetical protein I317_07630 [Kwoniella heveanensis CBS 569]
MHFSTRNAFYLRASNYRVVPLFLYLDERHVDWMSERVLHLVIAALQPKMSELLYTDRSQKKHKVHVERGEGYQYCYFLRTTTRTEVVLLKEKSFGLRPPTPPPPIETIPEVSSRSSKHKSSSSSSMQSNRNPKSRRASSRPRSVTAQPQQNYTGAGAGDSPPLRAMAGAGSGQPPLFDDPGLDDGEIRVKDEPVDFEGLPPTEAAVEEIQEETNIKDWKPDVDVSYKGFGTSSVQLVLIIEPYPPLPPSQYAPPSSRLSSRSSSIASSRSKSRSRSKQGTNAIRYSSTSLSVAPGTHGRGQSGAAAPNMRNASRSVSAVPNSRRGGTTTGSVTPFGDNDDGSTPAPGSGSSSSGRRRMSQTPLFMPRDTPFEDDEEDEEAHEAYEEALRQGRASLPSISRPAGSVPPGGSKKKRANTYEDEYEDEDLDDVPESIMDIGDRLVRNSQIEEGVVRVQGGWEERGEGEESAVMGKEEPGD